MCYEWIVGLSQSVPLHHLCHPSNKHICSHILYPIVHEIISYSQPCVKHCSFLVDFLLKCKYSPKLTHLVIHTLIWPNLSIFILSEEKCPAEWGSWIARSPFTINLAASQLCQELTCPNMSSGKNTLAKVLFSWLLFLFFYRFTEDEKIDL